MTKQSHIEQLIQDLCPNDVEWKALSEVCKSLPKGTLKMTDLADSGYPVMNSGKGLYGYYSRFNNNGEAITIAARGEYAGWVSYFNEKFWAGGLCYPYTSKNENIAKTKFIYHWLKKNENDIMDTLVARGGIPALNKTDVDKLRIPLPPISIQEEIIRVLDAFEKLIKNIDDEIKERQYQYEYARGQLFDFKGKEVTIDTVCNCYPGATPSTSKKEYWENGTIPWMSSGEVHQGKVTRTEKCITELGYNNCSTRWVPIDSVVIALAGQGKTRGCVALTKIELCTNQSLCALVPNKEKILPVYLYQYLKTQYMNLRNVSSGDGTRGGLNLTMIKAYPIPLPFLKEQQAIAAKLDTIEAFIANLQEERALRQQQYEYYRAKLISLLK